MEAQTHGSWRREEEFEEETMYVEYNYPSPQAPLSSTLLILPPSPTCSPPWNSSEHGDSGNDDSAANSISVSFNSNGLGQNVGDDRMFPTPSLGCPPLDNFDQSFIIKERMTQLDLDFGDLDASWSFDQIPTSAVLISSSDRPFSSLWAFADGGAALNFSDKQNPPGIWIPGNPEPAGENAGGVGDDDDDTKKLPTPVLNFTPLENFDLSFIIEERMTQALRYFKESTERNQMLAQIWAPVRSGNNYVLTTSGQPYVLGPHSNGLNQYRTVSLMYMFSVDGESVTMLGLPGRVFRQKWPEWTPDGAVLQQQRISSS